MHQPDEFDRIVQGIDPNSRPEYTDPTPYGPSAYTQYAQRVKTGLTPRGKAVMVAFAAPLLVGGLLGWQHYESTQAAAEVKSQQFALQQQQIELEKLKELNKANAAAKKSESAENSERKQLVDACVDSNKKMVGKLLGVTYQSVRGDCESQYPISTTTGDMQAAATAADTTTGSSDGGLNQGLLIGAGVLGLGLAVAVKRSTKSSPA